MYCSRYCEIFCLALTAQGVSERFSLLIWIDDWCRFTGIHIIISIAALKMLAYFAYSLRYCERRIVDALRDALIVVAEAGELFRLVLVHQRVYHLSKIALHDVIEFIQGQIDAVIGKPALGIVIGADALGAIPASDQGLTFSGLLRILLLLFGVINTCL